MVSRMKEKRAGGRGLPPAFERPGVLEVDFHTEPHAERRVEGPQGARTEAGRVTRLIEVLVVLTGRALHERGGQTNRLAVEHVEEVRTEDQLGLVGELDRVVRVQVEPGVLVAAPEDAAAAHGDLAG